MKTRKLLVALLIIVILVVSTVSPALTDTPAAVIIRVDDTFINDFD